MICFHIRGVFMLFMYISLFCFRWHVCSRE